MTLLSFTRLLTTFLVHLHCPDLNLPLQAIHRLPTPKVLIHIFWQTWYSWIFINSNSHLFLLRTAMLSHLGERIPPGNLSTYHCIKCLDLSDHCRLRDLENDVDWAQKKKKNTQSISKGGTIMRLQIDRETSWKLLGYPAEFAQQTLVRPRQFLPFHRTLRVTRWPFIWPYLLFAHQRQDHVHVESSAGTILCHGTADSVPAYGSFFACSLLASTRLDMYVKEIRMMLFS